MEMPGKTDDQVTARKCARVAHGEHRRLGAAHGEAHPLGAGNQALDLFGPCDFQLVASPVVRAFVDLLGDRLCYLWVVVPQ